MEQSLQILSERTLTAAEQTAGAPIVLHRLRVAYDYTYNREILFLKGTNQSGKTLRSVYFDLACTDDAGDELGTVNGACLRSLETASGAEFGENLPVVIPFAGTCSVRLTLQKVVFTDGTVWRTGDAPEAVAAPTAAPSPTPETVSAPDPTPEAQLDPAPEAEAEAVSAPDPAPVAELAESPAPTESAEETSAPKIPDEWLNPPATAEGYRAAAEGLASLGEAGKPYLVKKFTALADKLEAEAAAAARKAAELEAEAKRAADYKALSAEKPEAAEDWEALATRWKALGNYKDAPRRSAEAAKKAKSIRTSEKRLAEKRAEEAKQAAAEAAAKRRRIVKRTAWIAGAALVLAAVLVLVFAVMIPASRQERYEQAEAYLAEGKFTAAIDIFRELGDYKDSEQREKAIRLELTGREDGIFLTSERYPCYSIENGVLSYDGSQYHIVSETLNVPDYLDDQKVTALADNCFSGLDKVKKVILPPSVTSIGSGAFADCPVLTAFEASNLSSVGAEAFRGCTVLTDVQLPETVTSIGNNAFQGCTALQSISIPDGVRHLADGLFLNCTALTEVRFGDRIATVGNETFAYCVALPEITLPETVTSIGNNAFLACNSFTKLIIPDSVTFMGDKAMAICTSLTEVRLGKGLTKLASRTFEGSRALKTVYLPAELTQIGYAAFSGCSALSHLHYGGTADSFAMIEILADNQPFTALTPVFDN